MLCLECYNHAAKKIKQILGTLHKSMLTATLMCVVPTQRIKSKQMKRKDKTRLLFEVLLKVMSDLILLFLLLILVDLEVAQLVALLGVSHDPQPVPEVVLLQILLGEILQVPENK